MKTKFKKWLCCASATVVMSTFLWGCGSQGTTSTTGTSETSDVETSENTATTVENVSINPEDYPTIKVSVLCINEPTDKATVEEEISKITREKIGCNIEFVPIIYGNMQQQMSLLLSGGDDLVDIYFTGRWSTLSSVVNNGQAIALDEYLAPYEEEMKAAITESVYNCGKINGTTYGLTRYLNFAGFPVYTTTKEIGDKYGLQNGDAITLDQLTEFFEKVKADYPDKALVGTSSAGLNNQAFVGRVDNMGDPNILGGLLADDDKTVVNYYATDDYKNMVEYFKKWKEIGITMDDPLNVVDRPGDYLPSGKCLGCFAIHYDAASNGNYSTTNYGVECISVSIMDRTVTSPDWWYCVAPTCKNPDKAAAFLYLMTVDPDIENLLCLGVENVHYQILEDGTAAYIDGKDMTTTGWSMGVSWTWPNCTISIPFESDPDYYEIMVEANNSVEYSDAFGFAFDSTAVENEISACANVVAQYRPALECGVPSDMDASYQEFLSALESAGIDKIIEEKQRQLDEYLANK
ncbi:MAG: ABC transporter substrate-binding protein [Butyrivibrio sp.]|uniref:ABC transporter substrate-binding protein n=1 Tax=Butyrivibrio sp. TaxID=28121 RepID=UPI001B2A7FFB|nr:ABC transporter substrate-binding protein [Butyrivibrio sp.]MBO6241769.1 ABC transporter substrate-binding protein [Butyrivibrio sp.]